MDGLRIKIQHKGIQKLCNWCYGHHLRKVCSEEKVNWADYVITFKAENPDISEAFYGKWNEKTKEETYKRPCEKDFNLPTSREEGEQMLNLMSTCGINRESGVSMLKERKEKFELAVKEYELKRNQSK